MGVGWGALAQRGRRWQGGGGREHKIPFLLPYCFALVPAATPPIHPFPSCSGTLEPKLYFSAKTNYRRTKKNDTGLD